MILKFTKQLLKKSRVNHAVLKKIYKTVEKFRMTGSLMDKSETGKLVFFVDNAWFLLVLDLKVQNKVYLI